LPRWSTLSGWISDVVELAFAFPLPPGWGETKQGPPELEGVWLDGPIRLRERERNPFPALKAVVRSTGGPLNGLVVGLGGSAVESGLVVPWRARVTTMLEKPRVEQFAGGALTNIADREKIEVPFEPFENDGGLTFRAEAMETDLPAGIVDREKAILEAGPASPRAERVLSLRDAQIDFSFGTEGPGEGDLIVGVWPAANPEGGVAAVVPVSVGPPGQ